MFRQIWRLPIIWRCYRNTTPLLFSWWHTGLYKRQTQGHTFGVGLCLCWKNDDRLELNRILQMILHCWDSRTIRASLVATLSRDWNQPSGRPHHTWLAMDGQVWPCATQHWSDLSSAQNCCACSILVGIGQATWRRWWGWWWWWLNHLKTSEISQNR